jgi:hypothetical protein
MPTGPEGRNSQEAIGFLRSPLFDLALPLCVIASGAVERTPKGAVKLCSGDPL